MHYAHSTVYYRVRVGIYLGFVYYLLLTPLRVLAATGGREEAFKAAKGEGASQATRRQP